MLRVLQTHDLTTFPNYIKIQDMWCPNVYRLWPFISKNSWSPYSFFFNRGFPQNMKANISIWSTRIGWVENYIHRSEYNDLKMAILVKKKPARVILVIQFTYKGWINNNKKLWSYFNETKAEKKCMLSNWTLNISII